MNTLNPNTASLIVDRIDKASDNTNLTGTDDDVVLAKIEVSSYCNLNCKFCSKSYIGEHDVYRINRTMGLYQFKEIISVLKSRYKNLKEIGLFYIGEPGYNPNLKEMYSYLKDNGFFTFLTTNGTLSRFIIDAIPFIDSIKVSWNYMNKEDYINKVGDTILSYNHLINDINYLYKECHKHNKTLTISTVLDDEKNIKLYEKEIMNKLNYDFHYWIPLQNNGGYLDYGSDGVLGSYTKQRKPIPCWSLFKAVYVDSLGNIRPCCYSHKMKCGVIKNNTIRFATEEKDDFVVESNMKKLQLEGKIPDQCRECLRNQ